jgi:prepilin-type N-terminal cleavage/methylation domain-containing protein
MNNKGMTLIELIITIILVGIIAITIWGLICYGNKPVSEMPIWLYWLLSD